MDHIDVKVDVNDIKKAIYFISNLTQMQGNRPMHGALSSKDDYMGGIFDRWINIIPEAVIFNKIILPKLKTNKKTEVITDYYDYNPKDVGIAPDVIGIMVDDKPIPFVEFNNGWKPIKDKPQIEIKSFKTKQKMVSLRNQNYDDKYLILAETNFRIDYLIPLIDEKFFFDEVYNNLHMNDDIFIKNNSENLIEQPKKIDYSNKEIGTINLLCITTAKDFMDNSIKCSAGVSVEYFCGVEEHTSNRNVNKSFGSLSELCNINDNGLLRMNSTWYTHFRADEKIKTLDFYLSDIDAIEVLKILKGKIIVRALKNCTWENVQLEKNKTYDIIIKSLDRGSSTGDEYFMLKTSIQNLKNYEENLLSEFQKIIQD